MIHWNNIHKNFTASALALAIGGMSIFGAGCSGSPAVQSGSDGANATQSESGATDAERAGTEQQVAEANTENVQAQVETVSSAEPVKRDFFAMDTVMQVQAYGENAEKAVDAAQAEVERLDALLSTGLETSEVSKINESGGGVLSEDGRYLMQRSLELYEGTEGAFDITIYPVMELWGFAVKEDEEAQQTQLVPEADALSEKLALVDASAITFDAKSGEVELGKDGMKIDFGGIAKGYTSAQLMEIIKKNGVESALVTLGGNVQVLGTKPDGSAWKVGIQDPNNESNILCGIAVKDKAVITSGGYQRYFVEDNTVYHHIIDPATGHPANSGLISVTIVSEDGTLADGLATAIFIMGKERGSDYWRVHREDFDMILVEEDGKISVTEGVAEDILSDIEFETIS